MGFLDGLKKLTQTYDDDDDFFEGAEQPARPAPPVSAAQEAFEDSFGEEHEEEPVPARRPVKSTTQESGLLSSLGINIGGAKRPSAPKPARRERAVSFGGSETQVILFNPKSFEEAGELVGFLQDNRSVVMTLEGLPSDEARRYLDFQSGITFALGGKITPVSAKAYFISPHNVDLVSSQGEQPESDGQYL